ncbi:MAG: hypothetical protein IJP00_05075 [Firmicutes bacterium]|nr:hypothetical protein [Bacillota bacterium]
MSNKAIVRPNSNNNIIIQDSNISNTTNIVISDPCSTISALSDLGAYSGIQEYVSKMMEKAKSAHPLFPEFSVKYNPDLERLVSMPETKEALINHPKTIKGKYVIDYKKYPHMDKSETPWEYAYRTQSKVELQATEHEEFLGDIKDPYPWIINTKNMITIIGPPEFPEAREATLVSGDIEIPIMIRRAPSLQFGELVLVNTSTGHGFDIKITTRKEHEETRVTIIKKNDGDLESYLLREKYLEQIYTTRQTKIMLGDELLMSTTVTTEEVEVDLFKYAKQLVRYFEDLLFIEDKLSCKFKIKWEAISEEQVKLAMIMRASLENKWVYEELDFDDQMKCNYDNISTNLLEMETQIIGGIVTNEEVFLNGVRFKIDKVHIQYKNAKINNLNSVKRGVKIKRRNIRVTFKATNKGEKFLKYVKYEGIRVTE